MTNEIVESARNQIHVDPVDYQANKRGILFMLLVYSVILGIISVFLPEDDQGLGYLVSGPFLILGVWWCFTDASEHDYSIGWMMRILLVLMFAIGFPLYIFRTRGIAGFKTLGLAVLLVAIMAVCAGLTAATTMILGDALGLVNSEGFSPPGVIYAPETRELF